MASLSGDFLRFLQANYPDDFRLVPTGDVPDALANSLMSKHASHYAIWCQIPEWVKTNYHDKLPKEVLNGNETVQTFVNKEEATAKVDEKKNNSDEMVSYSVELLALGYTATTVSALIQDKEDRELMLLEFGDMSLTDEQKARWIATRYKDILAITKDWKENQPEKYALHLAKALSRNKKRLERGEMTDDERAEVEKRIAILGRAFNKAVKRLESRESRQNMVDYLRAQPQQAALRHLTPDILATFTAKMEDQGIKIEAVRGANRTRSLSGYDSLTDSLKKDFARMEKSEGIFRERARRDEQQVGRIKAHEVLDKQNDGIAKVVTMRRGAKHEVV